MDWDDVRVFLAVAREGSMRAAGRALGLQESMQQMGFLRTYSDQQIAVEIEAIRQG
jgi:hypothetical protein